MLEIPNDLHTIDCLVQHGTIVFLCIDDVSSSYTYWYVRVDRLGFPAQFLSGGPRFQKLKNAPKLNRKSYFVTE